MKRWTVGKRFSRRTIEVPEPQPDGTIELAGLNGRRQRWEREVERIEAAAHRTLAEAGLPPALPVEGRAHVRPEHRKAGEPRLLSNFVLHQGFEHDSPEHLAAEIIETVCAWRAAEDGAMRERHAYRLGELVALDRVYRATTAGAARAGRAPKRKEWAARLARAVVAANPGVSADVAFFSVPESFEAGEEPDAEGYVVYRDGDYLRAEHDETGRTDRLSRVAFRRYIAAAKKS